MDDAVTTARVSQNTDATAALESWTNTVLQSGQSSFDTARSMARRLGAHRNGELCEVMFWAPELQENRVSEGDIFIEVLDPEEELALSRSRQTLTFRRTLVPVARIDAWCFTAIDGMRAGTRDHVGSFYSLVWRDAENRWHRILDPLSASLPFGPFAPAEYYDVEAMQAARADKDYFAALPEDGVHKFGPPTNILQIHVPTATASMSLAGLTRHFNTLAEGGVSKSCWREGVAGVRAAA